MPMNAEQFDISDASTLPGVTVLGVVEDAQAQPHLHRLPLRMWVQGGLLTILLALAVAPLFAADPKVLVGHTDPAYAAVYTADGSRLLTASFDKTLRLWDLKSLTSIRKMEGHTGLVLCTALSRDGTRAVSGSLDNSVRLWDMPQSTPTANWQSHSGAAVLAVSADGTWVVTGGADKTVKIWNAADRQLVREIGGLPQPIVKIAIRADKAQIAVADVVGTVRFFNPNDGAPQGMIGAHTAEITGLGYPPNNAFLLTSGAEGIVRRWPVQLPATRQGVGHEAGVIAAKVSPNNALIASVAMDNTVRLWGFADAKEQRRLEGHTAQVRAIAWRPDGGWVLTGGDDKVPRVYDPNNAMLVKAFPESPAAITAVAMHPNNNEIAVADASGTIKTYRINEGTEIRTHAGHPGGTWALAYSPNQQHIISGGQDKAVRIWNVADGAEVRKIDSPEVVRSVAVQWDGNLIAIGCDDKQIRLHAVGDGSLQQTFAGHSQPIASLEFCRDQQKLLSASADGTARVWHLVQKRQWQHFLTPTGAALTSASWSPDNQTVLFAGADKALYLDTVTHQGSHQADEQRVNALAVHPNSAWHATVGNDGQLKLWDTGSGNPIRQFPGHQGPAKSVAIRVDQQQICSGGSDHKLLIWNINDPSRPQYAITTPAEVVQLAYSPDNKKLVAAGSDNLIRSYNPEPPNPPPAQPPTQEPAQITDGHTSAVTSLAFSNDNKTALSAAADGTARTWAIASAGATAVLNGHQSQVYAVAWHPAANLVASASNDKTIKLWDTTNNQNVRTFAAQGGAIYGLAFNADGKLLVSCGGDKTVRVYQTDDGAQVREFSGPTDAVYSISLSPNNQQLTAVGLDRKIFLWDFNSGQLLKTLSGHKDDIYRVEFNAAGTRLVTVGYAANLYIWDPQQDQPRHHQKLTGVLYSATWSPNGQQIAVMGNDSKVYLVDVPAEAQ